MSLLARLLLPICALAAGCDSAGGFRRVDAARVAVSKALDISDDGATGWQVREITRKRSQLGKDDAATLPSELGAKAAYHCVFGWVLPTDRTSGRTKPEFFIVFFREGEEQPALVAIGNSGAIPRWKYCGLTARDFELK